MGIKKLLANFNNMGFDIEYWRISSIFIDRDKNILTAALKGYSNKINRDSGEKNRATANLQLIEDDFPADVNSQQIAGNDIYKLIYQKMSNKKTGTAIVSGYGKFNLSDGEKQ